MKQSFKITEGARLAYVVAGSRPWNRATFDAHLATLPGRWTFIGNESELTLSRLLELAPTYVFFLHWSARVPSEILDRFECVCFHMTDVPYGRGGSPLQNLIQRGHHDTQLTALRMVEDFDAGPVYLKEPLSLQGRAQDIYVRAGVLSAAMIRQIVEQNPEPTPQQGEVVVFRRRKPSQSLITGDESLDQLHDIIRMLDADGYPHAFVEQGSLRFEFRDARLEAGRLTAQVSITQKQEA
ncbi:MAG: methionyl-tRNA formyltransferase [Pseudomonadota bacterium]